MRDQTPQEKEYNRMAMAKVRSDVKRFVHGDTNGQAHLGEYPKTMEEAVRTIIAVQDLLEHSMIKHAKCEEHLHEARDQTNCIVSISSMVIDDSTTRQMAMSDEIGLLVKQRDRLSEECQRFLDGWETSNALVLDMSIQITELQELRDAQKMVLRSSLNGEGLG
jgi:hypothetical protein